MNIIEPDDIFVNFLRSRVSEVTRTGLSNRQTADSQTFTATASQTIFTLTNTPISIVSVTQEGTTLYPYRDYTIDIDNKKITLLTGATVDDEIIVSFYKGNNWVFPDKPRDTLKKTSYPRIGVTLITESGLRTGMGETTTYDTVVFQVDVVTYKDQLCTISTETKEGQDVANYIARTLIQSLKTNFNTDLLGTYYDFEIISNIPQPFEADNNIFRRIIEVRMVGYDNRY